VAPMCLHDAAAIVSAETARSTRGAIQGSSHGPIFLGPRVPPNIRRPGLEVPHRAEVSHLPGEVGHTTRFQDAVGSTGAEKGPEGPFSLTASFRLSPMLIRTVSASSNRSLLRPGSGRLPRSD